MPHPEGQLPLPPFPWKPRGHSPNSPDSKEPEAQTTGVRARAHAEGEVPSIRHACCNGLQGGGGQRGPCAQPGVPVRNHENQDTWASRQALHHEPLQRGSRPVAPGASASHSGQRGPSWMSHAHPPSMHTHTPQ